jgi:hypothetical protein
MVREAATRLYDVDRNSVVNKRLTQSGSYDTGTVTIRPKPGKLIDLDQLHESIWATRLSGGTKSGLVSLDVTAVGEAVVNEKEMILKVAGSDAHFVLGKHTDEKQQAAFDELRSALDRGEKVTSVSGRIEGWAGRWPDVLRKLPPKPRRILVLEFETAKEKR